MGFRSVRLGLAIAALGAAFVSGVARAEPTAGDRETARSLMQEGRDLRDKGHLQDALKRFKAADDIMRVPTTGLELARTQAAMGLLIEARDTIAGIRKTPASPTDPEPFKEARSKAEELDTSLETRVPALLIVVQGAAEGETPSIVVDGTALPAAVTGLPRRVNAGRHLVIVNTPTSHGEATAEVKEGEQKEVPITLSASAPSPETPPSPDDSSKGSTESPESGGLKSHSPTPLTFVGIGVGGAGLLVGGITGILSLSKTSSLKSECVAHHCSSDPGLGDFHTATTLATISDIGFAFAGAGAVVALATLVVGHETAAPGASPTPEPPPPTDASPPSPASPDSSGAQSGIRITPWIGLGSAGVAGVF